MSLFDEVSTELERLGVDGWNRTIALELASNVDQRGTVSAAALLRTHMNELAREYGGASADTSAIDGLKRSIQGKKSAIAIGQNNRELIPQKTGPANKSAVKSIKLRGCVDCGVELPVHVGRGRPRVRCAGGC